MPASARIPGARSDESGARCSHTVVKQSISRPPLCVRRIHSCVVTSSKDMFDQSARDTEERRRCKHARMAPVSESTAPWMRTAERCLRALAFNKYRLIAVSALQVYELAFMSSVMLSRLRIAQLLPPVRKVIFYARCSQYTKLLEMTYRK